jgi:hypothetical protein
VASSEPSAFWTELGAEHAGSLASHGPEDMKRRQALRYFTWQWRWKQILRSEQIRFLLRHSSMAGIGRAVWHPGPLDDETWSGPEWTKMDRWLYTFATRLLWSYAARRLIQSPTMELDEPRVGNPFPVQLDRRWISQDLANTALELDAVRRAGVDSPRNIVEIGAGYGRTAYALLSINPVATYTVVDIEPSITISRWYLTQLFDGDRLSFVHADQLDQLNGRCFDLALSISSLQEMTVAQVDGYLRLLDRVVDGHVFLKQWERWRNPVDHTEMVFDEYPFPTHWRRVLWERCPVQTRFRQGVWRTSDRSSVSLPSRCEP